MKQRCNPHGYWLLALLFILAACSKSQEIAISDAWARASAPGQAVAAAYMTINSPQDSTLVYAESAAAGAVEIHSMTMENDVMKMQMLAELPLKAGAPVKLEPGGLHLMLFDLAKPLQSGERIEFRLCFKDTAGNITEKFVQVPVKTTPQ